MRCRSPRATAAGQQQQSRPKHPKRVLSAKRRFQGEGTMTHGDALSILKGKGSGRAQTNTKGC